jgi:hypothetical protein
MQGNVITLAKISKKLFNVFRKQILLEVVRKAQKI